MMGVSTSLREVSEKSFCEKKRSQFIETVEIFLYWNGDLPTGIFSRSNTSDIFENTVESGF